MAPRELFDKKKEWRKPRERGTVCRWVCIDYGFVTRDGRANDDIQLHVNNAKGEKFKKWLRKNGLNEGDRVKFAVDFEENRGRPFAAEWELVEPPRLDSRSRSRSSGRGRGRSRSGGKRRSSRRSPSYVPVRRGSPSIQRRRKKSPTKSKSKSRGRKSSSSSSGQRSRSKGVGKHKQEKCTGQTARSSCKRSSSRKKKQVGKAKKSLSPKKTASSSPKADKSGSPKTNSGRSRRKAKSSGSSS